MSEQFHGWGAFGADSIKGNFKEFDYTPKPFDDDDIESMSDLLFLL
jgi:alcohol dehydrogenase (NADP+)